MNVNLLIDAIVRQTTVLVAHLATAAGIRSPLAHIANQIFMDLVNELKQQGLGNKVIADMFALSLRAYQNKIRRLSESNTVRGKTLWEAVYGYIQQPGTVSRIDTLKRFRNDDEMLVRGVLRDLVESRLVFQSGVGESVVYRIAKPDEIETNQRASGEAEAHLVWVAVNRYSEEKQTTSCTYTSACDSPSVSFPQDNRLRNCETMVIAVFPEYAYPSFRPIIKQTDDIILPPYNAVPGIQNTRKRQGDIFFALPSARDLVDY